MAKVIQYLAVEADSKPDAIKKASSILAQEYGKGCQWFKEYTEPSDAENLTLIKLEKCEADRIKRFEIINSDLDLNRVRTAIEGYTDKEVLRDARLRYDIMQRFLPQVDTLIMVANFVAERWNRHSIFFDLENLSGQSDFIRDRLAANYDKQYFVPVQFMC